MLVAGLYGELHQCAAVTNDCQTAFSVNGVVAPVVLARTRV